MSIEEVAERCRISHVTARKYLKSGTIGGLKKEFGNVRVWRKVFEEWFAANKDIPRIDGGKLAPLKALTKAVRDELVYFVQAGPDGHVKIGTVKASNLSDRVMKIQVCTPYRVKLLATIVGGRFEEQKLHRRFKKFHVRGEWFTYSEELRKFLARTPK